MCARVRVCVCVCTMKVVVDVGDGAGPKAKKKRVTTTSQQARFVSGLIRVMIGLACIQLSIYIFLWLNHENKYIDYGDDGVIDEYPDENARIHIKDIPPRQTGHRKEPLLREAFPLLKWPEPVTKGSDDAVREDISRPIDTIRLRNTTQAEVDYYVTRGYVVVVEDMAKNHPMLGWSCDEFAERWPNGLMQGVYPTPWRENDLEEKYTVRLRATDVWMDTYRPAWYRKFTLPGCYWNKKCSEYIDNAADAASYAWFVKDREPQELKKSVQMHWTPPYYMESATDRNIAQDSFEMWFTPAKWRGGAYAHADTYCETAASMQLKGSKTWRIMNPGPRIDTYKDRFHYWDGEIYAERTGKEDQEWAPELLITVPEGGGIIFPPYAYHETVTQNSECSVSSTYTHGPYATRSWRHFMSRLLNGLGGLAGCHVTWDEYALWTMKDGTGVPDSNGNIMPRPSEEYLLRDSYGSVNDSRMYKVLPTTDKDLMTVRFETILRDLDIDRNAVIDGDELFTFVRERYYYLDASGLATKTREFLGYYDMDDSGNITKEELWDGWEHWNINSAYAVLTHMGGLWSYGVPRNPW